jgi:hypothetical protein
MTGKKKVWHPDPNRAALDEMSVTVRVESDGAQLEVIVALSRPNGRPPMESAELRVQVLDSDGVPLPLLEAPKGFLPEFGGGLGATLNARYRFSKQASPPTHVIVHHGAAEVTFRLTLERSEPEP